MIHRVRKKHEMTATDSLLQRPLHSLPSQFGWLAGAALVISAGPAAATSLTLQVTLPVIETASYYRPYMAAWVERVDDKAVMGTLAVWYDMRLKDGLGKGWLRHLRTWWRNGGEQLALPADGVSGATRAAGTHTLQFKGGNMLSNLPTGRYELAVEVAREQGGRELVRVPFEWSGRAATADAKGSKELDNVKVSIAP